MSILIKIVKNSAIQSRAICPVFTQVGILQILLFAILPVVVFQGCRMTAAAENMIKFEIKNQSTDSTEWFWHATWPEFHISSDTAFANQINSEVIKTVMRWRAEIDTAANHSMGWSCSINYRIFHIGGDTLSFAIIEKTTEGGPRPFTIFHSFNYSLKYKRRFSIEEILPNQKKSYPKIVEKSEAELKARGYSEECRIRDTWDRFIEATVDGDSIFIGIDERHISHQCDFFWLRIHKSEFK